MLFRSAEAVAEHFAALCKRYARAWGEELIGPWKKEFQRRGAPHLHISTTPPMGFTTITDPATGARRVVDFKTWLSITWADIVNHPDPEERRKHRAAGTGVDYAEGIKLTDPRSRRSNARIRRSPLPTRTGRTGAIGGKGR